MSISINIIARTNGVGLDRDVDLLQETLTDAGHEVTISHCRSISPLRRFFGGKPLFDANLFLERVFPRWFGAANYNLLIPNQERFPQRHVKYLKHIDSIVCKSRHAEDVFGGLGKATCFAGFTSADQLLDTVQPDYQSFFHLAGRSTLKGTEAILRLWDKRPHWPCLTILQCKENAPARVPANVRLITDYIGHREMKQHLNMHGIHLCTSLSEGWGHYIVEAMSCRAVVVTTDAPPMNELVTPERGVMVPYSDSKPRHLGTNFLVDAEKLETTILELLQMPAEQKAALGGQARCWFEKNDTTFRRDFPRVVTELIAR